MTYIEVLDQGRSKSGKTREFKLRAKHDGTLLGRVHWFGRWRCYVFEPASHTLFERVCLREIAEFVEAQTKNHKGGVTA